ncbi:unnamed protein product [Ceratitis capitata]|uniref:(Mediterranean fruit fly) hypothetical protein n=1 Tax=Ceratitis capitata TaxID=7213 RepID=A0A811VES7_CERCA|nr:unnamed protein product [Ceratitis capitata]
MEHEILYALTPPPTPFATPALSPSPAPPFRLPCFRVCNFNLSQSQKLFHCLRDSHPDTNTPATHAAHGRDCATSLMRAECVANGNAAAMSNDINGAGNGARISTYGMTDECGPSTTLVLTCEIDTRVETSAIVRSAGQGSPIYLELVLCFGEEVELIEAISVGSSIITVVSTLLSA